MSASRAFSAFNELATAAKRLCALARPMPDVDPVQTTPIGSCNGMQRSDWLNAEAFDQLPGPSFLQALPTLIRTDFNRLDILFENWREQYGDIYKFNHPLRNMQTVVSFRPSDAKEMFQQEGDWPIRPGFYPMRHYKSQHGLHQGLFSSNGAEWQKQRKCVQRHLLETSTTRGYLPHMQSSADWFVDQLTENRDSQKRLEVPLPDLAYPAAFQVIYKMNFGSNRWPEETLLPMVQENARTLFNTMGELEMGVNIWRYFSTQKWRKFSLAMDAYNKVVEGWCASIRATEGSSSEPLLLPDLRRDGLPQYQEQALAFDMLLSGIDTTGNALSCLLYRLATNQQCQDKLAAEINQVLPEENSKLSASSLNQMPYLRACIKESLRMNQPVFAIARLLGKPAVLSGYQIPRGTTVMVPCSLVARMENEFDNSALYIPERWLRKPDDFQSSQHSCHPFANLPFGHGRRMCPGRRLVEQELLVFTANVVKKFRLLPGREKLQTSHQLVCQPLTPLRLTFIERNNHKQQQQQQQ